MAFGKCKSAPVLKGTIVKKVTLCHFFLLGLNSCVKKKPSGESFYQLNDNCKHAQTQKKQAHSSFSVHIVRNRRTKRNQERAWASVRAAAFSAPHIAACHLFALMCCFYPQHLECFHSAGMMTPAGMPNFDLRGARWEHSVHYLSCGSLSVRRAVRHTPLSTGAAA